MIKIEKITLYHVSMRLKNRLKQVLKRCRIVNF